MFFIYYNNGNFECTDKLNITLVHMVELGVIKVIFDLTDKEAYISAGDGTHKKVKVTTVSGL